MLALGESAISNLGKGLDNVLADIFLRNVAVIVDEDFQEHHRVFTDFVKY